jgi:hypothetical protein
MKHGNKWNYELSNTIMEYMLKPNPHYWDWRHDQPQYQKKCLTQEHCEIYFARKHILEGVREKHPKVKEETLDRHLKYLIMLGWVVKHQKIWLRKKNRHSAPERFYSLSTYVRLKYKRYQSRMQKNKNKSVYQGLILIEK